MCRNGAISVQNARKIPWLPKKSRYFHGRSVGIRTRGLLDPNQARYQTSPHPVSHAIIRKYHAFVKYRSWFCIIAEPRTYYVQGCFHGIPNRIRTITQKGNGSSVSKRLLPLAIQRGAYSKIGKRIPYSSSTVWDRILSRVLFSFLPGHRRSHIP